MEPTVNYSVSPVRIHLVPPKMGVVSGRTSELKSNIPQYGLPETRHLDHPVPEIRPLLTEPFELYMYIYKYIYV